MALFSIVAFGQPDKEQLKDALKGASYEEKFYTGVDLMDQNYYSHALVIWKSLVEEQPDNANLNYKLFLKIGQAQKYS